MIDPLLAVLAGVLTIAAPCVLPMLPVVLGASIGQRDGTRPVFIALGFALAFSAMALLFGSLSRVVAGAWCSLAFDCHASSASFGRATTRPAPPDKLCDLVTP